ncbi:MAG: hypothetical protein V2J55_15190 [Candidatus Competibacteraceae bacterium]|jgi:predicted nucleic acid-binding protein|nr:hypothetical protein [Candidatus Competibacteraceae bacterium]
MGEVIDCLGQLFERVLIPTAVQQKCQDPETKAALQKSFFEVHAVTRMMLIAGIGRGELEAISLAVELGIKLLIVDDEKAFRRAVDKGFRAVQC